jgi:zinc/manganese transport system permease protein
MHDHAAAAMTDHALREGLAATFALALGAGPVGVFLMLRRMSLIGDAMSHAILPGAAVGFLVAGLNVFAMTAGALVAGLLIAVLAGLIARATEIKEDASLAVFLLVSLALGVVIVAVRGTEIDLMGLLFGEVGAINREKMLIIAGNATVSLIVLALIYRPLVIECVDPGFLRSVSRTGAPAHLAFLVLLVINLVSGFHAFGTLLGVGIMIIPAAIARFWTRDITVMIAVAVVGGIVAGWAGLLVSYELQIPSGPAVTLVAGLLYALSVLFGPVGGLVRRLFPGRHLEA